MRWIPGPIKGISTKGWFLAEINPLPPVGEREAIVSDIISGRMFSTCNGQVRHSRECQDNSHKIPPEFSFIKALLKKIPNTTFQVAVYPGDSIAYGGQPLLIALEPEINYNLYPDHPHINVGGEREFEGKKSFIPDSLCYTDLPETLGTDTFERIYAALEYGTEWLFRHLIWLETRKKGKAIWIGNQLITINMGYSNFLNPDGQCRCGKRKLYKDCHFMADEKAIKAETAFLNHNVFRDTDIGALVDARFRWINYTYPSQTSKLHLLKKALM